MVRHHPLCAFLLAIFILVIPGSLGQNPVVYTDMGPIRGSEISGVTLFRAIPYGAKPASFQKPQRAEPWQQEFDATQAGNICIQFQPPLFAQSSVSQSEDCLNLDIYVPRNMESSRSRSAPLLPVLVFIHGGSFKWGSRLLYNGTILAKRGNMIVVTINYRLGTFGFAGLDSDDIPGNLGLWDQRLALEWIQNNIREFGGNPKNVTIYGQSAGSISVSLHVLSEASKGLFSSAIMSSGMYYNTLLDREATYELTKEIARDSLGCDASSVESVLSCLQNKSTMEIADAYSNEDFMPFVDGEFLVEQPTDSVVCGRFNRVPIMGGYNTDECLLFMPALTAGMPADTIEDFIKGSILGLRPGLSQELRFFAGNLTKAVYFANTSDPLVNARSAFDFCRGIFWSSPAIKMARYFSQVGVPVYLYEYDEKVLSNERSAPSIRTGADHGDELFFIFGAVQNATIFRRDSTPEKLQFSEDLSTTWSDFVHKGIPSLRTVQGQQLNWTAYTIEDPTYALLKVQVTALKTNPESLADLVWNTLMATVEAREPDCSGEQDGSGGSGDRDGPLKRN